MKTCSKCSEFKSLNDFHRSASAADGRQNRCKPCAIEDMQLWKEKNKDKYDSYNQSKSLRMTLSKYGIPWDDWEILEPDTKNCSICGFATIKFVVDHDHATGLVRGFLCPSCNSGLGFFRDSISSLESAIKYLESPPLARHQYVGHSPDESKEFGAWKSTRKKRESYAPRYKNPPKKNNCTMCNIEISPTASLCSKHSSQLREKINWPPRDVLEDMVLRLGYSATGRALGVSDNAVRKRIKSHS